MKRFLLILAALAGFAIGSNAQVLNNDGQLYVDGDMFYMNGIPLNDGEILEILGEDVYNETYLPARKKLRTANTLEYVGGTVMGVGIGLAAGNLVSNAIYGYKITGKPYIAYGCITLAGLVPTLIAFNMAKNGRSAYAGIAETYNKNTGKIMELTLSPARSGFGIALNF